MKKKLLIGLGILVALFILLIIIGSLLPDQPKKDVLANQSPGSGSAALLGQPSSKAPATAETHKVTRVVDGDTIKVQIGDTEETIRLIGINTPETVDPRKPVECFGIEASNRAKALLTGQNVKLESDSSQDNRDKYGRFLRYVYLEDGRSFNLMMIQDGFAYEYTYVVPYKYQSEFKAAQKIAEDNKRGLWADGACGIQNVASPAPTVYPPPAPLPTGQESQCTIKGNISSTGEKIYHVQGCASYNVTKIDESKSERWFCSEEEALNAGWRKALNCP